MNIAYLGVSGSGKTYQMRHLLLDELYCNEQSNKYKQIYLLGREYEWDAFVDKVEALGTDDTEKLLNVEDSLIIIDGLGDFLSDTKLASIVADVFTNSRTRNNKIYLGVISFGFNDKESALKIMSNIDVLNIGYLFLCDRQRYADMFGVDYRVLPSNPANKEFIKIDKTSES